MTEAPASFRDGAARRGVARPRLSLPPPALVHSTVEDHVSALIGVHILQIHVALWLGARHDEQQVCHDRLREIPARSLENGTQRTPDARRDAMGSYRLGWEAEKVRKLRDRGDGRRAPRAPKSRDGGDRRTRANQGTRATRTGTVDPSARSFGELCEPVERTHGMRSIRVILQSSPDKPLRKWGSWAVMTLGAPARGVSFGAPRPSRDAPLTERSSGYFWYVFFSSWASPQIA